MGGPTLKDRLKSGFHAHDQEGNVKKLSGGGKLEPCTHTPESCQSPGPVSGTTGSLFVLVCTLAWRQVILLHTHTHTNTHPYLPPTLMWTVGRCIIPTSSFFNSLPILVRSLSAARGKRKRSSHSPRRSHLPINQWWWCWWWCWCEGI